MYKIKKGSSASIDSQSQSADALANTFEYLISLPSIHGISVNVLSTTKQCLTLGHSERAISTLRLSGIVLPPLTPSSAVITMLQSASMILSFKDSGEKPPKTTE